MAECGYRSVKRAPGVDYGTTSNLKQLCGLLLDRDLNSDLALISPRPPRQLIRNDCPLAGCQVPARRTDNASGPTRTEFGLKEWELTKHQGLLIVGTGW